MDPEAEFARCARGLTRLIEEDGAEIFASNQVIGEAYVAVQQLRGLQGAIAALVSRTCCGAVW